MTIPRQLSRRLALPPGAEDTYFFAGGSIGFAVGNILSTIFAGTRDASGPFGSTILLVFHLLLIGGGFVTLWHSRLHLWWLGSRKRIAGTWDIPLTYLLLLIGGPVIGFFLGLHFPFFWTFRLSPLFMGLDAFLLLIVVTLTVSLTRQSSSVLEQHMLQSDMSVMTELPQTVGRIQCKVASDEFRQSLILQDNATGFRMVDPQSVFNLDQGKVILFNLSPVLNAFHQSGAVEKADHFTIRCTIHLRVRKPVAAGTFDRRAVEALVTGFDPLDQGVGLIRNALRESLNRVGRHYEEQRDELNKLLRSAETTPDHFVAAQLESYQSPYKRPNYFSVPFTDLHRLDVERVAARAARELLIEHSKQYLSADRIVRQEDLNAAFHAVLLARFCPLGEATDTAITDSLRELLSLLGIHIQIEDADYNDITRLRKEWEQEIARLSTLASSREIAFSQTQLTATASLNGFVDSLANNPMLMHMVSNFQLFLTGLIQVRAMPDLLSKLVVLEATIRHQYPALLPDSLPPPKELEGKT